MAVDPREQQRAEWSVLYDRVRAVLQKFGEEDAYLQEKDYYLVADNLGLWQHIIETSNLELVRPIVIKTLQKLLHGYPNWEVAIAVSSPAKENAWLAMGLIIRDDEIIDGLQRQILSARIPDDRIRGKQAARVAVRRRHLLGSSSLLTSSAASP